MDMKTRLKQPEIEPMQVKVEEQRMRVKTEMEELAEEELYMPEEIDEEE